MTDHFDNIRIVAPSSYNQIRKWTGRFPIKPHKICIKVQKTASQ